MKFWVISLVVMSGSTEIDTGGETNADIDENLILSLIQGFGRMYNLTSVTACIPIPHSATQHIP